MWNNSSVDANGELIRAIVSALRGVYDYVARQTVDAAVNSDPNVIHEVLNHLASPSNEILEESIRRAHLIIGAAARIAFASPGTSSTLLERPIVPIALPPYFFSSLLPPEPAAPAAPQQQQQQQNHDHQPLGTTTTSSSTPLQENEQQQAQVLYPPAPPAPPPPPAPPLPLIFEGLLLAAARHQQQQQQEQQGGTSVSAFASLPNASSTSFSSAAVLGASATTNPSPPPPTSAPFFIPRPPPPAGMMLVAAPAPPTAAARPPPPPPVVEEFRKRPPEERGGPTTTTITTTTNGAGGSNELPPSPPAPPPPGPALLGQEQQQQQQQQEGRRRRDQSEEADEGRGPYQWGGSQHRLPETFRFQTSLSGLNAWKAWHHGYCGSIAWKLIEARDLPGETAAQRRTARQYLQKLRFMCRRFDNACNIRTSKDSPSAQELTRLYCSVAIESILPSPHTRNNRPRRISNLKWVYLARLMQQELHDLSNERKERDRRS